MNVSANVSFKWLGVTSFLLSDGKTTIMFDPAMTRVGFADYLPWRRIAPNATEVDYWMKRCGIKSVDATFVNHAHTDHVIDAPYIVSKYGGKLYGSTSTLNVGKGYGLKSEKLQRVYFNQEIQIGAFKIKPFSTPHPPHFLNIQLLDGHIESPIKFPAKAWEFNVGETYSFLITHPKGRILFHSVAEIFQTDPMKGQQVDSLLLTIANRHSSADLIHGRLNPSGAKKVIPLHFDNFFFDMRRDNKIDYLWGVDPEEFTASVSKLSKAELKWPKYCEDISLL
jgi:L-ascorbate metabolism protein UlaG (beta-lactamase superfamily)